MKSLKIKLFDYWIKAYCYNNALILNVKRSLTNDTASNLALLLLSPYIILTYVLSICYERLYGFYRVHELMTKECERQFKWEIAIVSISKNEGPYLKEWIEFHRTVGVQKFFFYDNDSEDATASILQPYIAQGIVEYTLIHGKGKQLEAYNDAIRQHKDECRWMAFIDMDEYLVPTDHTKPLHCVIDEIVHNAGKGAAGVAVNWATFGTSGHKTRPQGLIIENYIMRAENSHWINRHVKCVCNPRLIKYYISPHYPVMRLGAYMVTENKGQRQWGWFERDITYTNLRINHYYTKSEEDYRIKTSRGLGDREGSYKESQFNAYNRNEVTDKSMSPYIEKVRRAMEQKTL